VNKKRMAEPSTLAPEIYKRFEQAETKGTKASLKEGGEYWRRTLAPEKGTKGSSAYGPVQITGDLFKDVKDRRVQFGVAKSDEKFLDYFISQAKEFLKYGNEPKKKGYSKIYDYTEKGGGQGFFGDPTKQRLIDELGGKEAIKAAYERIAERIMMKNYKDSGTEEGAVRTWRGAEDSKYSDRYFN